LSLLSTPHVDAEGATQADLPISLSRSDQISISPGPGASLVLPQASGNRDARKMIKIFYLFSMT
jgi:hypothetical protein